MKLNRASRFHHFLLLSALQPGMENQTQPTQSLSSQSSVVSTVVLIHTQLPVPSVVKSSIVIESIMLAPMVPTDIQAQIQKADRGKVCLLDKVKAKRQRQRHAEISP